MTPWLSRNGVPIGLVVLGSLVVIAAFELLDMVVDSTPVEGGDAELAGVLSVAGLIKVSVFLGIGALIASPLRRRLRPGARGDE